MTNYERSLPDIDTQLSGAMQRLKDEFFYLADGPLGIVEAEERQWAVHWLNSMPDGPHHAQFYLIPTESGEGAYVIFHDGTATMKKSSVVEKTDRGFHIGADSWHDTDDIADKAKALGILEAVTLE